MTARDGYAVAMPLSIVTAGRVTVYRASNTPMQHPVAGTPPTLGSLRQLGSYFDGYPEGFDAGGGAVVTIENVTPTPDVMPGVAGALSANFSTARNTPLQFDLSGIQTGYEPAITIKFANRSETYVVRGLDKDGEYSFAWPFDAHSTIGDVQIDPVHISILPRDGWPPCAWTLNVGVEKPAVEA